MHILDNIIVANIVPFSPPIDHYIKFEREKTHG